MKWVSLEDKNSLGKWYSLEPGEEVHKPKTRTWKTYSHACVKEEAHARTKITGSLLRQNRADSLNNTEAVNVHTTVALSEDKRK